MFLEQALHILIGCNEDSDSRDIAPPEFQAHTEEQVVNEFTKVLQYW